MTAPALPAPAGADLSPRRSWLPATATQYLLWLAALVLIVGPLVPVVWASLWSTPLYEAGGSLTVANYSALLSDAEWWEAVRNSVEFALLATVGSVVLGTAMAVLFTRTDLPGRRLFGVAVLLPVVVPGLPLILGWAAIYAPSGYVTRWIETSTPLPVVWDLYSVPGMAMLAVGIAAPVVAMLVRGSLSTQDAALEQAARTAGASPVRALVTVTVPLLRPAVLNSGLIVFALSLEVLGLPLILGSSRDIDFISTYLYDRWLNTVPPEQGLVSAGAVVLLAVVAVLMLVRNRLAGDTARFQTVGGKATAQASIRLGAARWPLCALVSAYLLVVLVLPLAGLLLTAFTTTLTPFVDPWTVLSTDHFRTVVDDPVFSRSITNSLIVAVVGGALATLAIAALSIVAHRSSFRHRGSLQYVMLSPRAIPGLVAGMAFFWAFVVIDPSGRLRSSLWAIGLAFAVRSLALGYSAFYPALAGLGEDLDRAARTAGADWWTAMRTIVLRLLRPAMGVSFVLLFVAMLNDYDPAVFLSTPGTEVMGLTMLKLWAAGTAGPVAALGVIQVVVTFAVLGVGRLLFGVRPRV
ncbi:ABC transporter permease subunit [Iamia majanohamensis]|uniref:ABC transporter permease subunit n=1 Tax=Iamia majanohamensis TaxID=467976 RepID=A0AAE9YBR0_9ACTN|nr:ABC transporter permease subunit [Iamia majanohamensis]WCO68084.1 ABC transporter permease subunit [Iamia majanohamensis]